MRGDLVRLGTAYFLTTVLFGVALLFGTASDANDLPGSDAAIRTWFERLEMRMDPASDSFTISIGPWEAPLRRLNPDEDVRPSIGPFTPPSPEPRAIEPQKPASPLISRFANLDTMIPVVVAPDAPSPAALANVGAPELSRQFVSRESLKPVRIAPTLRSANSLVMTAPIVHVANRLRNRLSRELYANFDMFLYVSKSVEGPLAQHMYVFTKKSGEANSLTLLHDWPISTGREQMEIDNRGSRTSTATPTGYYQLDPKRFYRRYTSSQWGKPMPNSMFFDWMVGGYRTGLAIHGVSDADEVAALGTRASGGCVHLSPDAARSLFEMIQTNYRGMIPRFAYDTDAKTISNRGKLARDAKGELRMVEGYKALVVIENYGGQDMLTGLNMDSANPEG
jgi:lipoprotein-anchoring transpeptidase ErfK/SrfK